MGVDAKNFLFQTGLKAAHHRQDHDEDHYADGNSTDRDERDERNERLPAA